MLWLLNVAGDDGAPDVELVVVEEREEEAEGVHRHQHHRHPHRQALQGDQGYDGDCDVLNYNDCVSYELLAPQFLFLNSILQVEVQAQLVLSLKSNNVVVKVKVADAIDETLVEDLSHLELQVVVGVYLCSGELVNDGHDQHMGNDRHHNGPKVPGTAAVGKEHKKEES